jgi:hypothetical protein
MGSLPSIATVAEAFKKSATVAVNGVGYRAKLVNC